uniref:Uncharacterized protein n=1 Tax=Kalanchoe fedtschenkoi TaxID=63787 RepID=A0A7N0V4L5_KALFE
MKKRSDSNSTEGANKLKERHIVVWTQEEDDILREQIRIYGTDNWAIVASEFSDKTTRQCRRRWYTYLNSDFKKGGWTPEEDALLCESQRKYGNKWTEIAKMVSGRTDNAVKNRFSTLCKKKAKREALAEEDSTSLSSVGKKRAWLKNQPHKTGTEENQVPYKKIRRIRISVPAESCNRGKLIPGDYPLGEHTQIIPDLCEESSGSSDYSTGSTLLSHVTEGTPTNQTMDISELNQDSGSEIRISLGQKESEESMTIFGSLSYQADGFQSSQEPTSEEVFSAESAVEFGSPLQVIPLFPDESAELPSPVFSESERNFLIKALGMETPHHPGTDQPQPQPVCKRVLLHSL